MANTDPIITLSGLKIFKDNYDSEIDQKIADAGLGVTYTLTKSGNDITLTGSDGKSTTVTDSNTTYSFTQEGRTLTITPSEGDPITVALDADLTYDNIVDALGFVPLGEEDLPEEVTETTVANWGFTKNTGTYSKPGGGIPKADLDNSVQASLGKADTALQSFTESDPTVPQYVKDITESDIESWNAKADTTDIPDSLSDLTDDATHRLVTDTEKTSWNNKVDKVEGKSLISDSEITRLASVFNYDDTAIKGRVEALEDAGYITENAIETIKVNDIDQTITNKTVNISVPTKASDIGAMPTTDLSVYALASEAGYDLGLSMDAKTYVMTLELKNKAGTVVSTKTLDFPIESMVVNATYKDGKITLTLQSGSTVDVDITALVSGLVNDSFTIAGIDMKDNITAAELKTALGIPSTYAPTDAQANVIETIKVNNTALTPSSKAINITVPTKASDINAMADNVTHLSGDVPTTRTINGKALSSDITLSASDVNALPSSTTIPTVTDTYSATSSDAMSGKAVASAISGKQASLSDVQMNAVNSGITSTKVSAYDGYASQIASKGTYSKPSTGIPKTDLANDVQTSLGKADTALQSVTKSDVGLGNVGNFKAVSTVASQGLTDTEKANARANIGAGTSSFSGSYNDLTNKPTIPSAVTEATVSGWGFTKNTGTYNKPSSGIPKTDLANDTYEVVSSTQPTQSVGGLWLKLL